MDYIPPEDYASSLDYHVVFRLGGNLIKKSASQTHNLLGVKWNMCQLFDVGVHKRFLLLVMVDGAI